MKTPQAEDLTIGIVGFGQFGQLLTSLLPRGLSIKVTDIVDRSEAAARLGAKFAAFEEVCNCQVVVYSVPVQVLEKTIIASVRHMRKDCWAIDVSSVKVLPARWMVEHLPLDVDITCTHPLFGPQSAKRGLVGQKLVICNVRGRRRALIAKLARQLGIRPIFATPEDHDRQMAYVQGLSHIIGRAMIGTGRPALKLTTKSYQHLLDLCWLIQDDSEDLFHAIQLWNPFSSEVVESYRENINFLADRILQLREKNILTVDEVPE